MLSDTKDPAYVAALMDGVPDPHLQDAIVDAAAAVATSRRKTFDRTLLQFVSQILESPRQGMPHVSFAGSLATVRRARTTGRDPALPSSAFMALPGGPADRQSVGAGGAQRRRYRRQLAQDARHAGVHWGTSLISTRSR